MLNFIADLVRQLDIGDEDARVGFVKYGDNADNEFYLETYDDQDDLIDAILDVSYDGGATNTQEALREMHSDQFTTRRGDRTHVPNVAVVITDGESTVDPDNTITEAEEARRKGIVIFSVGIGNDVNPAELRLMSSDPQALDQNYFLSPSFEALSDISASILGGTCDIARGMYTLMLLLLSITDLAY